MDSRPDTSSMGNENNLAMIPTNEGKLGQNYDDEMARRIKNRERQRRYRARKRLEADTKKAHNTNNFSPPQRQIQVISALSGGENRILCRRKWKQDARSAHVAKQQEIVTNGNENNLNNYAGDDDPERRVILGRRHWKADARNKKY